MRLKPASNYKFKGRIKYKMWLAYWCGKVGMWLSFEANLTSGNSTNARVLLKTHNLNIWCHSSCRAIVYCGIFWAHFCPHNVKIFRSLSGIIFCCYGTRWAHKHKRQIASEKQCAPSAKISNHLLHSPNCRIYNVVRFDLSLIFSCTWTHCKKVLIPILYVFLSLVECTLQ